MRKSLLSLIVAGLMSGTAGAHIGDNIYLVYEIADADVADAAVPVPAPVQFVTLIRYVKLHLLDHHIP